MRFLAKLHAGPKRVSPELPPGHLHFGVMRLK